ncbi:hypothetical protein TNCT_444611 [Trichonephila clavata]|uniref:Uncharacterized protein n=1 Tax=Trichonephila clavata TaxID=2740835 RepID=A0A8X6ICG0_TRICU|nr:hypothetical protein TNCT_444611 [Trichonephila clavata]
MTVAIILELGLNLITVPLTTQEDQAHLKWLINSGLVGNKSISTAECNTKRYLGNTVWDVIAYDNQSQLLRFGDW